MPTRTTRTEAASVYLSDHYRYHECVELTDNYDERSSLYFYARLFQGLGAVIGAAVRHRYSNSPYCMTI